MSSRLHQRLDALERCARSGWRTWEGRPVDEWPDDALLALLAESQGWPLGRQFTDEELAAIAARSRGAEAAP